MTGWGYAAQYGGVALMGVGVGLGELVSRYKDDPVSAITSRPGLLYLFINAAASAGALALILTYGWKFGASGDSVIPTRLLIAGFGAMVLFRSALFTVRIGNSDVGVGPSTFLSLVLAACDRGVDRQRAERRAETVGALMRDVDYEKAKDALPAVALGLMQNLDPADQTALGVELSRVNDDSDLQAGPKALLLGLAISNAVGPDVLEKAKSALVDEVIRPGGAHPAVGPPAAQTEPARGGRGLPATPQTPSDPGAGP